MAQERDRRILGFRRCWWGIRNEAIVKLARQEKKARLERLGSTATSPFCRDFVTECAQVVAGTTWGVTFRLQNAPNALCRPHQVPVVVGRTGHSYDLILNTDCRRQQGRSLVSERFYRIGGSGSDDLDAHRQPGDDQRQQAGRRKQRQTDPGVVGERLKPSAHKAVRHRPGD